MHKSRFNEEQIIKVLKEHAAGLSASELSCLSLIVASVMSTPARSAKPAVESRANPF
jgi:hypothetical protein